MRKRRRTGGFTMAELLIVVAIIAVLGSVSFIAVQNHQRDMARLERDAVARELFVAAQNHLTMADSQGYNGQSMVGSASALRTTAEETGKTIYYVTNASAADLPIIDVMLPFGAIDETVRAGGRYIIRYQDNPARVIDVFYWTTDNRYGYDGALAVDADLLALGADNMQGRRRSHSPILGWYGGEAAVETGATINNPSIAVKNAERLTVEIVDNNYGSLTASLKLIIKGEKSNAMKAIDVGTAELNKRIVEVGTSDKPFVIVLDAATPDQKTGEDLRFSKLDADTTEKFIPGEDITVQAVAYSNLALTNIAYSGEYTVNSLFAEVDGAGATAYVGNFRHLENLDPDVSSVAAGPLGITKAAQIDDMDWRAFKEAIAEDTTDEKVEAVTVLYDAIKAGTTDERETLQTTGGHYKPVNADYLTSYDGRKGEAVAAGEPVASHTVTGVTVDYAGDAGLFGAFGKTVDEDDPTVYNISNLTLVDFSVTGTTSAGALAGKLTNTTVSNVLAYHGAAATTGTATGDAGGLIGSMVGGRVEECAAALLVEGDNAGGLIGKVAANGADAGTVIESYSGGHTGAGAYSPTAYNVTGTTAAGGLVGSGSAAISQCYSTCSASGATAGGLIGAGRGDVSKCYAVGLVKGTEKAGAFAGRLTGSANDCQFYELVNLGMSALGEDTDDNITEMDITELDADTETYDAFVGTRATWNAAVPYDAPLAEYYEGTFNLKTVSQLDADTKPAAAPGGVTATHYGDWPAPETFVVNTAITGS